MNVTGRGDGEGRRIEIAAGMGPRWNELARLVQCKVGGLLVMPHRVLPSLVALIVVAWACPARAEDFTGKVVGVSDGDTITVLRGRTLVKIRLHGIDAPETGQDFGTRAKQAASELAFGEVVTVQPRGTDRYGRTVAVVLLPDGRNLNHELVRSGYAWWYRTYAPGDATLAWLETEARGARRGLWSQASPIGSNPTKVQKPS
jgi:endonuclease YncB( thermonuclease family)